jgi:riboflavin synthase
MFSGIIEHKARILEKNNGIFRIENTFADTLIEWQSIAHDGACMTLTNITSEYYEFFTMKESLSVTNFEFKKVWGFFNVERCLKIWDRIDGHMVSGHIDTVWKVILIEIQADGSLLLGISYPNQYDSLVIKKWSITINGVSLTIVSLESWSITVSLIPLTQDWTNLWNSSIGDPVNIEFDMIGKYIQRLQENNLQVGE